MSTQTSSTTIGVPYIITSRQFPTSDPKQLETELTKSYEDISYGVNARTIGMFNKFQIVTGDQYYADNTSPMNPIQFRQGYRQLFAFTTIAAGATLTITHGITGITELVHCYGNCVTVTPDFRPIPYSSVTAVNQQIELRVTATQIIISNGAGAPNITSGTIILEYLLN